MGNETKIMIEELIERAKVARQEYSKLTQEDVDRIVKQMAMAVLENHMMLAKLAVDETKRGIYEDKMTKNIFASEYIYHSIKDSKTVGIIQDNEEEGYAEIAEPIGIIAGITPVTNPTSTTCFKSLIAAKTRNVIIFGFHPSAQECSVATAKILLEAAVKAGAPKDCILWIDKPSIEATKMLMNHPDVDLILATGGKGMVKSAYSCGKPALGVGPGNVPCYIHKDAKLKTSVNDLVMSKSFDNGMICASEQAVIVDEEIHQEFEELMKDAGCYFVNDKEKELLSRYMFTLIGDEYDLNSEIVGKDPCDIAEKAGFLIPLDTKIIVVREHGIGKEFPFSKEKLSPILTYYLVSGEDEGISLSEKLIEFGGLGHSAVIHTENQETIDHFSTVVKVGRIIVNSPSTHGAIGDIYNTNMPSLTLGCGTFGGNSTTDNVSSVNLINLKRVAKRQVNMQWFKVPPKIYFESGSIKYLSKMSGITNAFIVTDSSMLKLGYVDKVIYQLEKHANHIHFEIFSEVEPDPSFDTIDRGVKAMGHFTPDVIIALGGGSVIDAAKGMWLFYEHPDVDKEGLKLKFLDIRKRTYKYPKLGLKAKFVAIPTTSGTGSEVTSFAVITDKNNNVKYPFADYELTPDVAIIDPDFVLTLPKVLTADTGMDVFTHAIEAYVSTANCDFTDPLALHAIKMIQKDLVDSYHGDMAKRDSMHNAQCLAGMAFSNALLGIVHSMAHKTGAAFADYGAHIIHGAANAMYLPKVIAFNAKDETAKKRYGEIADFMELGGNSLDEKVQLLIAYLRKMNDDLKIPHCIKNYGQDSYPTDQGFVPEEVFLERLPEIAANAILDACTGSNPRQPSQEEMEKLLKCCYYDTEVDF